MPQYTFLNKETGEYRDIFFKMNDEKNYNGEDGTEEGIWQRVFHPPQLATAIRIDPFSQSQFVRAGDGKKDLIGDNWDRSREMSERRADIAGGIDPVKQKYFDEYSKKTKGAKHFADRPDKIETKDLKVDFTK